MGNITITDIAGWAERFMSATSLNVASELDDLKIYESPIFGVASAEDPLFMKLKEPTVVGEHHLTPQEWLPGARTVISYFLPFTAQVREANWGKGYPALEWVYGRYEGEVCNSALRQHLCEEFEKAGLTALAPAIDERFKRIGFGSNWSERHVAFIAGLGTFGLSRSLISRKGCAGRYGSVIIDRSPTYPTPLSEIDEYCNKCGACIDRCPVGAISMKGKEQPPCYDFVHVKSAKQFAPRHGCGKCQTAVPCEHAIPTA